MNYSIVFIILLFSFQTTFCQIKVGRYQSFDSNWKFKKGKEIDAKAVNFNDADWRKLDVPHDWSIEDLTDTPTAPSGLSTKIMQEKTPPHLR